LFSPLRNGNTRFLVSLTPFCTPPRRPPSPFRQIGAAAGPLSFPLTHFQKRRLFSPLVRSVINLGHLDFFLSFPPESALLFFLKLLRAVTAKRPLVTICIVPLSPSLCSALSEKSDKAFQGAFLLFFFFFFFGSSGAPLPLPPFFFASKVSFPI